MENLEILNQKLKELSPLEIIEHTIHIGKTAVVTTNFRPYEAAILHAVTQVQPNIPVIWCDTGYNTKQTYQHAESLIKQLELSIDLFVPKQTAAHRNVVLGIPEVTDPNHALFSHQVKLEPFQRAMKKYQPDVWFTNLRKGQTAFRDTIDIVSKTKDDIYKVSPFYHYSDEELDAYLATHQLPNEFKYYDPTKAVENRECGIHN